MWFSKRSEVGMWLFRGARTGLVRLSGAGGVLVRMSLGVKICVGAGQPNAVSRNGEVQGLLQQAPGLPAEFAADVLLRLAESGKATGKAAKMDLLRRSFELARGGQPAMPRTRLPGQPVDSRDGYFATAFVFGLDTLSLELAGAGHGEPGFRRGCKVVPTRAPADRSPSRLRRTPALQSAAIRPHAGRYPPCRSLLRMATRMPGSRWKTACAAHPVLWSLEQRGSCSWSCPYRTPLCNSRSQCTQGGAPQRKAITKALSGR